MLSPTSLPVRVKIRRGLPCVLLVSLGLGLCSTSARAGADSPQSAPARTFTVQGAIGYALANYPAVQVAVERYVAARGGVGLARTSYIPTVSLLYQEDRATRNAIASLLMPQSVIANPSGTVLPASSQMFWGSGAGVLLSYDVLDFGYRRSQVRAAESTEKRSEEELALTRLQVAATVADASLLVLGAQQQVQASAADVARRTVFAQSVHALVDAKLRPGADASRVDAELAEARNRLVLARETERLTTTAFARVLGLAGTRVAVSPGPFLSAPEDALWQAPPAARHPAALAGMDRVDESRAQISVIEHSYLPHISIQALASKRGSGANAQGRFIGEDAGLEPNVASNWGAGVSVSFQPLAIASVHEQKSIELAREREQQALYDQTVQNIESQTEQAQAVLEAARQIAANVPEELQASRDSERQAVARFKAGLGTIVDVADAQRLLLQAQIDASLATLNEWRALARLAAAQGDLGPFVELANRSAGEGR